jgi:hypothetical protein
MQPVVPRRNARPPIPVPGTTGCSPHPGVRPTVQRRPLLRPRLWSAPGGYPADHAYVRRYWTAAIGAGAVADLLRVMQAAKVGRSIRRPVNTPALARAGLVIGRDGDLWVRSTVPPVPPPLLRRLPPSLRQELAGAPAEA